MIGCGYNCQIMVTGHIPTTSQPAGCGVAIIVMVIVVAVMVLAGVGVWAILRAMPH